MEVSHVKDHVTHAVIGGGQNIGFGISDSAEFFNILSSTLYKDQKLAVIREVLCNAWDAHIAAGKQGVPVQITLSRDEFVIRDFGLGIPHDKIGPIYTVYGNSTKKHDGKQTGGFGLGCKAPFAYTDHFEVTSWSEGKKSLYNVSKSAAEVMGKPGMKLIQQVDCGAETGLQVRIKLKTTDDRGQFMALINTIARNGEMNMELNHELLETIPFSKMTLDFLITTRQLITSSETIVLRYGNVIYPVSSHEGFAEEFKAVRKIISVLSGGDHYSRYGFKTYYLVLQAPPHSISVTPSREELSMQDHTVATLKRLLQTFADRFARDYQSEALQLLDAGLEAAWKKKDYNEVLTEDTRIPGNVSQALSLNSQITTIPALVRYHTAMQYPKIDGFRKLEVLKRLDSMLVNGWGNRGLIQAYRNLVQEHGTVDAYPKDMKWFYNHVVSPLIRGMEKSELLDKKRLFTVGYGIRAGGDYTMSSNRSKEMIREVTSLESISVIKMWPYLRNIVVISYTRNDVAERLRRFPEIRDQGGKMNYGFMLYVVPRNAARVEAARQHFGSKYGVQLLDLTVAQEWEAASTVMPVERVYVRRKKQAGWPAIASIRVPGKQGFFMEGGRLDSAKRITDPKWFTWLPTKEKNKAEPQHLDRFSVRETQVIMQRYGDTGAIALTKAQEAKLREAGAKPIADFVREQVIEEISNNERIGYWAVESRVLGSMEDREDHFMMICGSKLLRESFGLTEKMRPDDHDLIALWEDVKRYSLGYYREQRHSPAVELNDAMNELEIPQIYNDLVRKIKESDMLQFLDVGYLSSAFNKTSDAGLIKKALSLYLQTINN